MTARAQPGSVHEPGGHHHRHDSRPHIHGASEDTSFTRLSVALALISAFMLAEVTAGALAHSLALISDAAHMLTDAAALALSLVAIRLAARPARGQLTFGYRRAGILAAQLNGATLLVLGLLIVYEGVRRLINPPHVAGAVVAVVALVGVGVNLLAVRVMTGADRSSLNVEGAFQHLLTDLAAFLITALGGGLILLTGWRRADGIASLAIAAIMLTAAYRLLLASGRVLLEAAPSLFDVERVGTAMVARPGVCEVHDLHIWEVGSGFPALSAHVLVSAQQDCHVAREDLARMLHEQFQIDHSTLQVEHERAHLLEIQRVSPRE